MKSFVPLALLLFCSETCQSLSIQTPSAMAVEPQSKSLHASQHISEQMVAQVPVRAGAMEPTSLDPPLTVQVLTSTVPPGPEWHEPPHHSAFTLDYNTVDNGAFYRVFAGMVVFLVFLDRLQEGANQLAHDSRTMKKFLQAVYHELMLFGVVGLLVFAYTNVVGALDGHTYALFELVDLMCSFAAASLILFAGMVVVLFTWSRMRWAHVESSNHRDLKDYQLLSRAFTAKMGLADDFSMCLYLDENLVENSLEIVEVEWTTWLIFATIPCIAIFLHLQTPYHLSNWQFVRVLTCFNWICLGCQLSYLAWVEYHYRRMWSLLRKSEDTSENPFPDDGSFFMWALKLLLLANSFLIALFLMATLHNDKLIRADVSDYCWQIAPLATCSLFTYPMLLFRYTVLQGFYCPEHSVIGAVLEEERRAEEDTLFLRNTWISLGRPKIPELESHEIDMQEFGVVLAHMKIYLSEERKHRLFMHLDGNKNRKLSLAEFNSSLSD